MASNSTINKRVNIYINGREVSNNIKSIRAEMQKAINEIAKMTRGSEEYNAKAREIRTLKTILQEHNEQLNTATNRWSLLGKNGAIKKYFGALSAGMASIAGIIFGIKQVTHETAKMDDIYSDVSKTTNLSRQQVIALNEAFKKIDTRTTREQLNALATDAGKLGISGKKDILDFVDAGNQINVALGEDLGEGAIKNIGKLSQVFRASTEELQAMDLKQQMLAIGSAINELGSNSTASEAYLVNFAQRLGGVASQAGISIQDILGYASALDQSGQAVEMSATALQNFIMKLMGEPAKFAKIAGLEVSSFTQLLRTDTNAAILQVLKAMNSRGGFQALIPIFQEMGLDGARAVGVLSALATSIDKVTQAQKISGDGFAQATSITEEYNKKNNNLQAAVDKSRKVLHDIVLELGEKLSPALLTTINGTTDFVRTLSNLPQFYKEHKTLIWSLVAAFIALQGKTILATAASLKDRTAHLLSVVAKKKNALATLYLNTYTEQYNKTQGRLHPTLLKARTAFTMLGRAMMANPIGTAIIAFTALKNAIDLYDRNNSTAIRLEKEKKIVMDGLNTSVAALSEKYKTYQGKISTLNRLSATEKKDLLDKLNLTIANTKAEIANYKAKQLSIKKDNERVTSWQMFWTTLTTMRNPFSKNVGIDKVINKLSVQALENGKKAADEMNAGLVELEGTLSELENQKINLGDLLNAESIADTIGTGTITELQEKVNLYSTALKNAIVQSEDYIRIQQKLIATEKLLNDANKNQNIPSKTPNTPTGSDLAAQKLTAEKKLAQAITAIRQKLNLDNLTEAEKEILQTQQKYSELLAISRQFGLDSTEITKVHEQEINAIIDKSLEDEVNASISAYEQINRALMSSSEREKADIRQKYQELITLAEQNGIDTVALKNKMDEELSAVKDDEEPHDIFGMSPDDWEKLQEKITMAIDMAGQLSNIWGQFNQIQANRDKKELQDYEKSCNRKKELLNKQLNSGRISQEQYNARVSQLDADLEKKKTEIAKKQAKRDKAQSIFSTIINTASAVVQALNGPWPASLVFAALAAAMGAAQIAVIASQPLPEYAEGGMTKGAKMYIAGEAGQEWIAPNDMLQDPITGPIINRLEMVRSGIISPEQLILPDFQTMSSVPLYSTGGYTSNNTAPNNYYTTETTNIISDQHLESIDEKISKLIDYLSDPKNRQATISNDLLRRNEEELNMMNRLKRI